MASSTATNPEARPVPRKIDSTASSQMLSPSSPRSPMSPTSPSSPSAEASYFTREPRSLDQSVLQRVRPSSRPRSRSRSKSPLPSPSTSSTARPEHARSASDSVSQPTSPSRPGHVKRKSRSSGTVMQCGRHSNDWLFGGISVTDTVKGFFHKDEGRN
ncbi:MAG: hypothetical protein M1830_002431 [Pleopsidium flavum]|nr:MAG: hypothetical protein M1830_002431 [Pleopsidium flavum]